MKLDFSGCSLDLEARRLLQGTREIHLSPKAFELLKVLVEARPRALAKAELLELVWPGVFVTDASLARVVTELRQALGDRAREGRIIRTVHGYGYALGVQVEQPTPVPASSAGEPIYWLVSSDRTVGLSDGEHVAGREPGVAVWLDSPKVSRHHARLIVDGSVATIEDLNSRNGTYVRESRIAARVALEAGDIIRIGPFTLTVRVAGRSVATEPESQSG